MKTTTKLALSSMKKNLSRTILTGIAIFLTTLLLAAIGFGGNGILQENKKNAKETYGEHFASFLGLNYEQRKQVELQAQLYNVGNTVTIGTVEHPRYKMTMQYQSANAVKLQHRSLQSGDMPVKNNEIAAQKEFFQALGDDSPKIGSKVGVPFRVGGQGEIQTKEFVITGFAQSSSSSDLSKSYQAYVSEAFMEECFPEEEARRETLFFQVRNEDNKNEAEMKQYIQQLAREIGIGEQQININTMYLMYTLDPGTETISACLLIMAVIILFSVMVIYNIFHVAVVQKIKEFGRLKAIGASRKQLKQIVRREGIFLSILTIPFGLIIGMAVCKMILSLFLGAEISVMNWGIFAGVALLSFLTVMGSIHGPLKTAAKISPIEAIRYESGKKEQSHRTGKRQVSLFSLTLSNLALNKKRTITTILTMGLSCVLFVVVSNVVSNMDSKRQARQDIEFGRFRIEINGELNDKTYPEKNYYEIQKKQPFGPEFLEKVKNIEGVTEVRTRKIMEAGTNVRSEGDDMEGFGLISIVDEEEFQWLLDNRERGEVDYEKMTQEQGCIYMYDYWMQTYGYEIGDMYDCEIFDGDRRVPFSAKIIGSCGHSNDADITITEDTFQNLDIQGDMTSVIFVDCEKKDEGTVRENLENLLGGMDNISMASYTDTIKLNDLMVAFMRSICYVFLIILGVIGFMNMANTMITSIITRKREFGILQAAGMSNRQFNRMLQTEGLIFTAGTLAVALSVGNLLGWAAFCWCKKQGWFGLFEYRLPFLEIGIMVIAIALLQFVLSWVLSRNVKGESIVERIRYEL